jgi:hypothetical protein
MTIQEAYLAQNWKFIVDNQELIKDKVMRDLFVGVSHRNLG